MSEHLAAVSAPAEGKRVRRLSVPELTPPDIILEIKTPCEACGNDTAKRAECTVCDGVGAPLHDYEIRGNLPVELMVQLLDIERRIRESEDGQGVVEAVAEANKEVNALIAERNPSAPYFQWGLDELLGPGLHTGILGFIVNNSSIEAEVTEALTAGLPVYEPGSPEAIARDAEIAAARADNEEEDDDGPLASGTRWSDPSSPSAPSTNGKPSGGETADGDPSVATP